MARAQDETFTAEERAAVQGTAAERRAAAGRRGAAKAAGEAQDLVDAIAKMTEPDRVLARRVADLVAATAPELAPKTWYGMPAWSKDGKTLLFFKNAAKFNERYSTLGFTDAARLDDGAMWPKEFALTAAIGAAEERRIVELIERAVG